MSNPAKYVLIAAAAVLLASCGHFSLTSFIKGDPVARVGRAELYREDFSSIFTPGLSPEDSLTLLDSYVDTWVKHQLKLQLAEENLSGKQRDIDRLVADYRQSLMILKFEQQYLDRHLDTLLTDDQMRAYYTDNRGEFTVVTPLLKAVTVQLPAGARQEAQLRALGRSQDAEKLQDLIDICIKNNIPYREFTEWTDLNFIYASLPGRPAASESPAGPAGRFIEIEREGVRCFIIITDRLEAGGSLPYEMVRATIRTTLLNKRKQETLRTLEDSIYRQAQADGAIVIQRMNANEPQ